MRLGNSGRRRKGQYSSILMAGHALCVWDWGGEGSAARVTVTNDPIANLGKGLSDLDLALYWFVCLSHCLYVYVCVCVCVCLPAWPSHVCRIYH